MKNLDIPMRDNTPPVDQLSPTSAVARIINTTAFQNFFDTISNGGFLLIIAAAAAFIWSNISPHGYATSGTGALHYHRRCGSLPFSRPLGK